MFYVITQLLHHLSVLLLLYDEHVFYSISYLLFLLLELLFNKLNRLKVVKMGDGYNRSRQCNWVDVWKELLFSDGCHSAVSESLNPLVHASVVTMGWSPMAELVALRARF